jgi:ribose transport system substrate-binding protein
VAWHERSATVATSVVSGLIVAGVLKAVNSGIADGVVLLWFALATVGAGTVAWVTGILIRRRKRSARAFLMTSAVNQKYLLADFVQKVHVALDRNDIDMVLKVPDRDYDASAQSHNLDRLAARRRDYLGGIIIAAEMHRLREDLTAFLRKTKLPVVFTDLEPFDRPEDYPENAVFAGYDTGELGEMAGQWLVRHLRDVDHPHVLILASRDHNARQHRCEQALRAARADVRITINDQCAFNRSRARDAVHSYLRDFGSGDRLDAVCCSIDEMARRSVDALTPSTAKTRTTVVIGIDGTVEARALIDSRQSPLRATVVQDTHRLANHVVDVLQKLRQGRVLRRPAPLTAEIYEVV